MGHIVPIFQALLAHPIIKGALTGALGAAAADYHTFLTWKSFSDIKSYNWSVATFRWLQGAVIGAVGAAGLGYLA